MSQAIVDIEITKAFHAGFEACRKSESKDELDRDKACKKYLSTKARLTRFIEKIEKNPGIITRVQDFAEYLIFQESKT